MKEYISRLKDGCKLHTFIYWSLLRVLMLAVAVAGFISDSCSLTAQIHMAVCFLASFLWEFSQAMPEGSLLRFMPSSIHTALNTGLFISSFFGVFHNLYYQLRFFDPLMTALFAFWSVLYGYEIAYSMVKKYHFSATKAMVFYAAFGVSFIFFNACELGEFFCDQIIGLATGDVGNAQFWSVALSEGTGRSGSIIDAINPERIPLMDIMADIIVHFLSAFTALIFINVFPYRLRGRYKYDIDYGNNKTKTADSSVN